MHKEACGFRDSRDELQRRNVVVLGISPDGGATHEKFVAKYHLPFILLSDPDKPVMQQYGAFGEKVMYGKNARCHSLNRMGWTRRQRKRHWKKVVKAAEHPAEVLRALTEEA